MAADHGVAPGTGDADVVLADYVRERSDTFASTAAARDACYALLGDVEPDVLAPLVNPASLGGPTWPSVRQAWTVIHRRGATLAISNGLSDPFDRRQVSRGPAGALDSGWLGYGVEVYTEMPGRPAQDLTRSWLFDLIYQVSQNVAHHGQFLRLIDRHSVVSMLLEVKGLPAQWLSPEGMAGLLIGLPAASVPASFDTPHGPVRLLAVTLLHPREVAFLESSQDILGNRQALVDRLSALPDGHVNDLGRASVITD
ncbi:hypothetical protein [Achromobacter aloeverae]|uniref:Suppressor of fused protein (SUFU) n=1 Tax=Achromobacter aloeverae TaxID=1750518 RepID=A0A4Q1HMZ7_9BURK|nr:hypothetical protein [Achromobacter aloeverae]RXN92348.1 hypothetical protein C7R54_00855 [Achromobacter aloeverae]